MFWSSTLEQETASSAGADQASSPLWRELAWLGLSAYLEVASPVAVMPRLRQIHSRRTMALLPALTLVTTQAALDFLSS